MSNYNDETVNLRKYLTGIIGNAPFGIVTLSSHLEVGIINNDAVRLLGFTQQEPKDLIDTSHKDAFIHVSELLQAFESFIMSKDKRELDLSRIKVAQYTVNIKIRELFNGTLLLIEDITTQAELEDKLRHQANHDSLTKLANRHEFEGRVEKYISKALKKNLPGAVLFIDLDRFKPVNDTAGHAAGDELLQRVANLLNAEVRERDLLARIGGDEFAVLLEDCPLTVAERIAESMRKSIDELLFVYEDNSFSIGISVGIAPIGGLNNKLSTLINAADNACQIAKNEGRNCVHVAHPEQAEYEQHQQQVAWLPKINKALASNMFVLYAQEIFYLGKNPEQKHYEILIRLRNEDGTIIPPGVFIPPAERYDLMPQIDRWVLEQAFRMMQPNNSYSINLSGQSASDANLADYIIALQEAHNIDAKKVSLEITETAAIQNIDKCMALMNALKRKGFKFSLDDFGSGLSSFSYLRNMPVDYLKIDGSFVKDIANDKISYAMVKSINEVGHSMGIKTIAEFVENEKILLKLKEIGVDYAQGYHIHKPQPLTEITSAADVILLKVVNDS